LEHDPPDPGRIERMKTCSHPELAPFLIDQVDPI
jgi:hypothetical protein